MDGEGTTEEYKKMYYYIRGKYKLTLSNVVETLQDLRRELRGGGGGGWE